MRFNRTIIIIILIYQFTSSLAGFEELLDIETTVQFHHEVEANQDGQSVFTGSNYLELSRPDSDTLVIMAQHGSEPTGKTEIPDSNKFGLVVRTLGGRISSIVSTKSTLGADLNYLKSLASVFFIYEGNWPQSYEMMTDIFGTCEVLISRNESASVVERDLTRCSHASTELVFNTHSLPLLHLGMSLSGSLSTCTYNWKAESRGILDKVSCIDEMHISKRFSDVSLRIDVSSLISWKNTTFIDVKVYDYMREATKRVDIIYSPVMKEGEAVAEKDVNEALRELCLTPREHLTKKSLWTTAEMFYALSRSEAPPDVLKYPCPSHIRRSVAFSAALVGGSRLLSFVHDQMMTLVEEGEDLLPNINNPLIAVAISNLAQPKLNPKMPSDSQFFNRPENIEKLDKLIEVLLVAGPGALHGVTNLLQKLRHQAPDLFKETLVKASPVFSPEEACSEGGPEEATRILHALSPLSIRPPDFVASLRSCFATEDVGVQVSAMTSLGTLECDTPGVLELQQLALESPSDPEIRIAAFKGLIDCLPRRPILIQTLKSVLDADSDNYSNQVASFVWSYLQSILVTSNPSALDLRLELEDDQEIISAPDPVFYDPRQHSRHLENVWILDPRTSVTVTLDLIWGRASAAPRSMYVSMVLNHDGIPYDMAEITLRISSIESAALDLTGLTDSFDFLKDSIEDLWRVKRKSEPNSVKAFIDKVISRIPADYLMTGSSIQLSLSLLGLPAYHLYKTDFHKLLNNITAVINDLIQSDLHSELFNFMPLIDNCVEIGTSAGVPIRIHLHGSAAFQSLISHYSVEGSGNVDAGISGGFLMKTDLAVGRGSAIKDDEDSLTIKKDVPQEIDQLSHSVSAKYSWSFDLPLSLSFENKEQESRLKFRRPVALPHFLWQEEIVTAVNDRKLPVRYTEHCAFHDEPIHACLVVLEARNFSGKLQILNNDIFKPTFFGLKFVIPKGGYGPIMLTKKKLREDKGRSVATFELEIPTDGENLKYEANFKKYSKMGDNSVMVNLNTPSHKYYMKGFVTYPNVNQEKGSVGLEVTFDEKKYGIRVDVHAPESSKQLIINLVLIIKSPEYVDLEILKSKFAYKENPKQALTELSCSTMGPLIELVNIKFSGEYSKSKKDSKYDFILNELTVEVPQIDKKLFSRGQLVYSGFGIDSSLHVVYGDEHDIRIVFSKGPTDLERTTLYTYPQLEEESFSGYKFMVTLTGSNLQLNSTFSIAFLGTIKKSQIELDINFRKGEDYGGRVTVYSRPESFLNFKTILSVDFPLRNISWACSQELLWEGNEYKTAFNVSWSQKSRDHFGFLCHFIRRPEEIYDHSLILALDIPQQEVEIFHDFSKAVAGSYRHNFVMKLVPGREITIKTVTVAGTDPNVITYGLSVDFKLDGWESSLRIVGTANCGSTYSSCTMNVVVAQGPDQISELEIKYTGAVIGISRTDVKLVIEKIMNLQSSIDIVHHLGSIKVRSSGDIILYQHNFNGELQVNWLAQEMADANFVAIDSFSEQMTHFYNASLLLNKDFRSIFFRQELRVDELGNIKLWAAILQARIGEKVLNEKHFAKVMLTTPYDTYYSVAGEMSSDNKLPVSFGGSFIMSADFDSGQSYLLGYDVLLQRSQEDLDDIIFHKMEPTEQDLLTFSSLGRVKIPAIGESKLSLKVKRAIVYEMAKSRYTNIAEARLVTESFPELGRLNAKLDHDEEGFSLSGRLWSGSRSLAIESYYISRNESLKSSSTLNIVDPSKDWQMVKLGYEAHHLGTFPLNFESAVDLIGAVRHESYCSLRGLAQWTPSSTAFNLAVGSFGSYVSGGQIFFKWTHSSLQSRIAWSSLRTYLDAKWDGMGRQIGFVFNFFYPDIFINNIDSIFNFEVREGEFWSTPQIVVLKGRLTVNNIRHWIANINVKQAEQRFSLMIASIQPLSSSSVSIEAARENSGVFHGKGSVVMDASSHHANIAYRSSLAARDLSIQIQSSLFEEKNGYTYRIFTSSSNEVIFELDLLFAEGSSLPTWSHLYRLIVEPIKGQAEVIQEISARDYYIYKENSTEFVTKQFFKLNMAHGKKESSIEIVFPQFEGSPVMDGTVTWPDGDEEISCFFRMELPDNNHIIEAKFFTANSGKMSVSSLRRLIYRQKMIKGIGHKLRAELEISVWNSEDKSLRFSFQKLFSSVLVTKGHSRKGGLVSEYYFRTIEGAARFTQSAAMKDYKLTWKTEDTLNELTMLIEKDQAGQGGHIGYTKKAVKQPDLPDETFLLKGKFRRFPSEVFCSVSFEQSSLGRPRSVTYLRTFPEIYSELILDLAKSETDQVTIGLLRDSKEKRFKIGQLGNTFLQVAHKIPSAEKPSKDPYESFLLEVSGHLLELKVSQSESDERCRWFRIVTGAPSPAAMHSSCSLCTHKDSELKIQLFGLEENEGPYLRVGRISGPGGLGLQLGGGKLSPIDTPPALTVTGDVKNEYLEILFDWQINSMNQLMEDFQARKVIQRKWVKKLKELQLNIKGDFDLENVFEDVYQLYDECWKFIRPFYEEIISFMDEADLATINTGIELINSWLDKKMEESKLKINEQVILSKSAMTNMKVYIQTWTNLKIHNVQEVFDFHLRDFKDFSRDFCPLIVKIAGGIGAIRFNDNQSLYALTSRIMSFLHKLIGRHRGLQGFIVNDFLARLEKVIARKLVWENVKSEMNAVVDYMESVTPINIIMSHDTAFRMQIYPPQNPRTILAEEVKKIQDLEIRRLFEDIKSFWRRLKARVIYLTTPHLKGSAALLGWDLAISWDGLFLPSLLSNSCPHVLIMLTKSTSKTALLLHLEGEEHFAKRVLTFISDDNEVTIDSDFKIKINGASTRMERVDFGNFQLRKSENDVKITSSDGLMLHCLLQMDGLCLLEVDKKNFAATAGLLGVYDFEANTDFMTSSWERPASEIEWSSSWRITTGDECRSLPKIRPVFHTEREKCVNVFSDQASAFKDCLPSVSPKPYKEACKAGKGCGAEQAYVKECVYRHYLEDLESSLSCTGPPNVLLELKAPTNELYEGDDATFECKHENETDVIRVEWYRDSKLLSLSTESKLEFGIRAMTIHQIQPNDDGIYQCKILNSYGTLESNKFPLIVLHKPMCAQGSQTLVLAEGSSTLLECNMKANPSDVSFGWGLQSDVDYIQFPESRYTSDGLFSTLEYTVWTHLDFGSVYCLAENDIGQQTVACEFQITPEGECIAPIQVKGTDDLDEEIIIIGEFSCIDRIEDFIKVIKKESYRPQRIILKYLNEGTSPENIHDFDSIASVSEKNILPVLEAALREDFSQDALKVVVLMDCQRPDCKSQENTEYATTLQETLRSTGVHLYTISEDVFTIPSPEDLPNKVKKQLLGIDRGTAYLMSHAKKKNLNGKKSIRRAVEPPKDNWCSLLALQSNGATFSLSVLKKMKKNSHKKMFQQFVGLRVLEGLNEKYLKCRNCPCNDEEPCKLCKPPPPLESSSEESTPDQDAEYEDDLE